VVSPGVPRHPPRPAKAGRDRALDHQAGLPARHLVGGTLTGRGGSLIIVDDPMKAQDAYSEAARRFVIKWFLYTLLSRLDDKSRDVMVVVMQRLHVDDLAGHLLAGGGWVHLSLPVIAVTDEVSGETKAAGQRWRLPAAEIEGLVRRQLAAMLADPQALLDQLGSVDTDALRQVVDRAGRLGDALREDDVLAGELLQQLVVQVRLDEKEIRIELKDEVLRSRLGLGPGAVPERAPMFVAPVLCKRRGVETRLVLAGKPAEPGKPDPALLKAIARGHVWLSELVTGAVPSIPAIAARNEFTPAYVSRLIDTALLAPDIVQAILDGRQPVELTAQRLMQHRGLALEWNQQRRDLGFAAAQS
jgi:hypothetical protein